jgi:hypothetical protein
MSALPFTPAAELFCELRDLDGIIVDLVAAQKGGMWHWPAYYLMLVEADRLGWLLRDAAANLQHPIHDEDATQTADNVALVTAQFGDIGARVVTIVNALRHLSGQLAPEENPLKARMRAHVQFKSAWRDAFDERYNAGTVTSDGHVLERTVLVFDATATRRITDETSLVREQRFDLSTDQARAALHTAATEARRTHSATLSAMTTYFLADCTIEALAHPCSA